jgi:hypothetical protein
MESTDSAALRNTALRRARAAPGSDPVGGRSRRQVL